MWNRAAFDTFARFESCTFARKALCRIDQYTLESNEASIITLLNVFPGIVYAFLRSLWRRHVLQVSGVISCWDFLAQSRDKNVQFFHEISSLLLCTYFLKKFPRIYKVEIWNFRLRRVDFEKKLKKFCTSDNDFAWLCRRLHKHTTELPASWLSSA